MEQHVKRIELCAVVLAAVATAGSLAFGDARILLGVAAGAGLGVLNFHALRRILQAILAAAGRSRQQVALGVLLGLKFTVLATGIFLLVKLAPVNPIALVAGLSVVVLAIFVEGIRAVLAGGAVLAD